MHYELSISLSLCISVSNKYETDLKLSSDCTTKKIMLLFSVAYGNFPQVGEMA